MDMAEWASVLGRIAPALERLNDAQTTTARVNIPGDGNQTEQLDRLLDQLPDSHVAGMESTFRPRSQE